MITFRRSKRSMRLLRSLIGPFQQHFKKKCSHLAKKKVLFHQDNARVHTCPALMAKFNEFRYCFPIQHIRFSPLRLLLFSVSKLEEMVRRKEIHHQRAAHRRNRSLFWRIGQIILFRRLEKVGESLDQVYRAEKRLCWNNYKK